MEYDPGGTPPRGEVLVRGGGLFSGYYKDEVGRGGCGRGVVRVGWGGVGWDGDEIGGVKGGAESAAGYGLRRCAVCWPPAVHALI